MPAAHSTLSIIRVLLGTGLVLAGVAVVVGIGVAVFRGAWGLWYTAPLLSVMATLGVIWLKARRGRLTAEGLARCDQVAGFQAYLAKAEADQLRFEEGEDIISRYLRWAIVFGVTEHWAAVCADLVRRGQLADTSPAWYSGGASLSSFGGGFVTQLAGRKIAEASSSSSSGSSVSFDSSGSSGSGFGGGSSFGSGGSSGSGGGGGGSSSW